VEGIQTKPKHISYCSKELDMTNITSFQDGEERIGLSARRTRSGAEWELVQRFIQHIETLFYEPNLDLAVFYEPRIDTGFPDVVIAQYDTTVFNKHWSSTRFHLQVKELKLLQHLYRAGSNNSEQIAEDLGLKPRELNRRLEQLTTAGLVIQTNHLWKPVNIEQVYGIKQLIAVEAKISGWQRVIMQAHANTWFASKSYVLSPVRKPMAKALVEAERWGLGVYLHPGQEVQEAVSPRRGALPACHASWLFNEWIGRRLYLCG